MLCKLTCSNTTLPAADEVVAVQYDEAHPAGAQYPDRRLAATPTPTTHAILTQLWAGESVFQTHLLTKTVFHSLGGAQPLLHASFWRQSTVWDTFGPHP